MDELNTNGGVVADATTAPAVEVEETVDSEGTHPTTEGADVSEVVATPATEATVEATEEVVATPATEATTEEVEPTVSA